MSARRARIELVSWSKRVKFLCPACERLLDLERFSLEGGALVVSCQQCGVASRVGATRSEEPVRLALTSAPHASNVLTLKTVATEAVVRAAAAAEAALEVPAGLCPKCLTPRAQAPACPACGLAFETYRPGAFEPPTWLRTGWVDLLRDWGNDARHERLRHEASARGALPELARLYRLRLASSPEDPWAVAGREEVLRLAQAAVTANRTERRGVTEGGARRWLLLVAVVGLMAAAVTVLARMLLYPQG